MGKKLLSITIDEELFEQLKNRAKKGELSKFTEEVIQRGLNASNDLTLVQHLKRALALAKNLETLIPVKEEIEQDEYKTVKDFLYKRYIELRNEFDDTTPLSQQDVSILFDNNIEKIMKTDTVNSFDNYMTVRDSVYNRFINIIWLRVSGLGGDYIKF